MKLWSLIFALIGVIVATLVSFPLAWIAKPIVPDTIAGDMNYTGTVWDGAINNIDGIGSINIHTNAKNLIRGKPAIQFASFGSPLNIQGEASRKSVSTLTVDGPISSLASTDKRFSNLFGSFNLAISDFDIQEKCEQINGTASTDFLTQNESTLRWSGPLLSGPITCEDGGFKVILMGSDEQQTIKAEWLVWPEGEFRMRANVLSGLEGMEPVLALYGFERTASGYQLNESGRWR